GARRHGGLGALPDGEEVDRGGPGGGDRGRGPVVERPCLPRREPGAAVPARRARDDRGTDRRRGPDADDRVPALRRPPLPPRLRPGGGLRAATPPRSAAVGPGAADRHLRRHRSVRARLDHALPDARPPPLARPEPPAVAVPADLARPLLRG